MSVDFLYVSDTAAPQSEAELEFRQLRYFAAVAEELHFGRAAARMYISQPALSQAIAGLERTLDVRLFARTRQNVELTRAGEELLRHARGLLADREAAVAGVRQVAQGAAGVLHLGVALLAEHDVAPAFNELTTRHPQLLLDRSVAVSERLLASLQNRDLEVAVVHLVPVIDSLEGLAWELVRRGRLAALISEANPLAGRDSISLEDLRAERLVVPPRELAPSALEGMKNMCRTYGGFDPELVELSTSTFPPSPDWQPIVEGEAIALMPEGAARAAGQDGAVVVPVEPPPQFMLAMVWRDGNGSPALHRFLDFIRAYRDEHSWVEEPVPVPGP